MYTAIWQETTHHGDGFQIVQDTGNHRPKNLPLFGGKAYVCTVAAQLQLHQCDTGCALRLFGNRQQTKPDSGVWRGKRHGRLVIALLLRLFVMARLPCS